MKAVNSIMVLVAVLGIANLAIADFYGLYGNDHLVITPETVMVEPGGSIALCDNSTAEITSTLEINWPWWHRNPPMAP